MLQSLQLQARGNVIVPRLLPHVGRVDELIGVNVRVFPHSERRWCQNSTAYVIASNGVTKIGGRQLS